MQQVASREKSRREAGRRLPAAAFRTATKAQCLMKDPAENRPHQSNRQLCASAISLPTIGALSRKPIAGCEFGNRVCNGAALRVELKRASNIHEYGRRLRMIRGAAYHPRWNAFGSEAAIGARPSTEQLIVAAHRTCRAHPSYPFRSEEKSAPRGRNAQFASKRNGDNPRSGGIVAVGLCRVAVRRREAERECAAKGRNPQSHDILLCQRSADKSTTASVTDTIATRRDSLFRSLMFLGNGRPTVP